MEIGGNFLVAIIVVAVCAYLAFKSWAETRHHDTPERAEDRTED